MTSKQRSPNKKGNKTNESFERYNSKNSRFMQTQGLSTNFEMQSVIRLAEVFDKKVRATIQLQCQLVDKKVPQRCQLHNNILSLYCERDRKMLCASCIYQNDAHRKHKVLPINDAYPELHKDIAQNRQKLTDIVQQLSKVRKNRDLSIQKMDHQYPHVMQKLQRYYTNLHQILVRKEKEQIHRLAYLKEKYTYENAAFITEINRIIDYINEVMGMTQRFTTLHQSLDVLSMHRVYSTMAGIQNTLSLKDRRFLNGYVIDSDIIDANLFSEVGEYLIKKLQLNYLKLPEFDQKFRNKNKQFKKSSPEKRPRWKSDQQIVEESPPNRHQQCKQKHKEQLNLEIKQKNQKKFNNSRESLKRSNSSPSPKKKSNKKDLLRNLSKSNSVLNKQQLNNKQKSRSKSKQVKFRDSNNMTTNKSNKSLTPPKTTLNQMFAGNSEYKNSVQNNHRYRNTNAQRGQTGKSKSPNTRPFK